MIAGGVGVLALVGVIAYAASSKKSSKKRR
jgi:hypothetical protein